MIDKIGLKTTIKELVAYKTLKPGENEIVECAKLSGELHKLDARPSDPNMILFYDPKDEPGCRREVIIPIEREVEGIETKMMPEIKVAFLVFVGTHQPIEYYYEQLYKYIEDQGSFIDEDSAEAWHTEIMIPVEE